MNGHDFTLEQNTEARMMLAVARRGLAAAINDAENGIGHLSCDDPQIMEQVRAHWRRLYDTYMNADALLSDLESCARHLTDGDKWEHISSRMRPLSFFDAFMYSSLNLRVTCRFVAMLILSSIRQAKQDRYRSRSFPMRHHYALRAQKT